jgi:metal-responsive CopG/Arc/MetJ family transcriptional regulator
MPLRKGQSISLPTALLKEARTVAKREGKTPIELMRDAVKQYVAGSQFRALQAYGIQRSRKLRLKEEDVQRLIEEDRETRPSARSAF